jgi:hypothetical protein
MTGRPPVPPAPAAKPAPVKVSAFLAELAELLAREHQPLTHARVMALLVQHWGGQRVHIGKHWEAPPIVPTDTPGSIQERHPQISRRTAYRWASSWRR